MNYPPDYPGRQQCLYRGAYDYPPVIRRAIYTTNAIESINSVIRKFNVQPEDLPKRRLGPEGGLHGYLRGVRAMDDAGSALERGAEPLRHHVRESTT